MLFSCVIFSQSFGNVFLRFLYVVAPKILYPFVFSATLSRQWILHKLAKTSGLQNPGHLVHIQTSVVRVSRSLSKFSRKKYRKQMGHALLIGPWRLDG